MNEKEKEFIKNSRKSYMNIGSIECPAFQGEKIYFTNKGFKHLLFKEREYRSVSEQTRRLKLLPFAPFVLSSSTIHIHYRKMESETEFKNKKKKSIVHFWSFEKNISGQKVVVIVRQINNEPKHFFSVMNRK